MRRVEGQAGGDQHEPSVSALRRSGRLRERNPQNPGPSRSGLDRNSVSTNLSEGTTQNTYEDTGGLTQLVSSVRPVNQVPSSDTEPESNSQRVTGVPSDGVAAGEPTGAERASQGYETQLSEDNQQRASASQRPRQNRSTDYSLAEIALLIRGMETFRRRNGNVMWGEIAKLWKVELERGNSDFQPRGPSALKSKGLRLAKEPLAGDAQPVDGLALDNPAAMPTTPEANPTIEVPVTNIVEEPNPNPEPVVNLPVRTLATPRNRRYLLSLKKSFRKIFPMVSAI